MYTAPTFVDPDIARLPTVNLHTHLEGSVRPETFMKLAVERKLSRSEAVRALQVTGEEQSLVDYLEKIAIVYPFLKNLEILEQVAFEAAEDAAQDGVVYLELRAGPLTHSFDGPPVERIIESILRGLQRAEKQRAITCRLIVAALRSHDPKLNQRLAEIAVDFASTGVVGFDLAGDEANYPAALHRNAVRIARDGGLGITIHAGEASGYENAAYAVNELGATRIGHGIRSIEDKAVMELLKNKDVLLELCPTSNVHTLTVQDILTHPVRRFFDFGIPIAIGDDDPITSDTRVSRELMLLRQQFAFTIQELKQIQQMALHASFLESAERKQFLSKVIDNPAQSQSEKS